MKITTQGNGIRIGERLEKKIAAKMSKFDKYFGENGAAARPRAPWKYANKRSGPSVVLDKTRI